MISIELVVIRISGRISGERTSSFKQKVRVESYTETKVGQPTKMRAAERKLKADEESKAKGPSSDVRRSE